MISREDQDMLTRSSLASARDPFCISSFEDALDADGITLGPGEWATRGALAAIRFDRNPCQCDRCQGFDSDVKRYGRSPLTKDAP